MSEDRPRPLTHEWATFAEQLRYDDIPATVREKVLLHTLDQLGAEVAGSTLRWNAIVREYAVDESPEGLATAVRSGLKLRPEWASLANGTAGHGFEIDDYHAAALSHPGCVAVPAVMAVGEELDAAGPEVVVALTLGFEMIVRLGLAVQPSMIYDRGFHETCAAGVFAAALVSGRLRGFDAGTHVSALGVAGSHASGTTEYSQSGGEVKRLHAGIGAMGGLRAAALAARGFEGPRSILEGRRGFLQAFAETSRPDALVAGLGERWQLLDMAIKPYCCCGLIHAPIDAVLAMVREDGLEPDDVEEMVVGVDRLSLVHVGKIGPRPRDMTGAQFSMEYSLGMTLALGGNEFPHYREAEAASYDLPAVTGVAERVRMELDEESERHFPERFFARVRVRTTSGAELERTAFASGSPEAPLSGEDVRGKYRRMASEVLGDERAERTERAVDALTGDGSVRGVMAPLL